MPTPRKLIRHIFAGGWASDRGTVSETPVDEFGRVAIPYLLDAENVFFELDGAPHKIGGSSKVNSTAVGGGATVTGCFDYWKQGAGGSPTQKRVIHAGTVIYSEDLDGTFDSLFTGLQSGAIPHYTTFDDILIIASSATADVPKSWDQSTAQDLAGTPPNFSFSEVHKGHLFAAGVTTNPSTLYFSVPFDPEDWTGAGSGSIQIDPGDGDRITAIASHKNELWVFKGPYRGSIHRITGSSSSDFARTTFVNGLGAVYQNSLFRFADDLGFIWSDGSVHSLKATASFGDFSDVSLSREIDSYLKTSVNFSQLEKAQAANFSIQGYVLIALPVNGATDNNVILMMDYRSDTIRWAKWTAFTPTALCRYVDASSSNKAIPLIGSDDGFVRELDQIERSVDSTTAINGYVETPFIHYGTPIVMKTISAAMLGFVPKGAFDLTFQWTRDLEAPQSITLAQGGGATLAPTSGDPFILDTSTLGGNIYSDKIVDLATGGDFRAIKYEISNNTLSEDFEIHAISVVLEQDSWNLEN